MNIENFDQFRLRMEQQLDKLKQASRPSRFIPPANFALVDIYPHEEIAHGAIRGEVLDISPAGMKIAIHAHLCVEIDQSWTLILGQSALRVSMPNFAPR